MCSLTWNRLSLTLFHSFFMSTNARIGIQLNGGIVSVYHHWDGYPQWLGVTLSKKYTTKEDVSELIDGGNMSCIASDTDWDRKKCAEHVQYYTGRGESIEENAPKLAESITEYFDQCDNCGAEYAYIFDKGEWFCYDVKTWSDSFGQLIEIPEEVAA